MGRVKSKKGKRNKQSEKAKKSKKSRKNTYVRAEHDINIIELIHAHDTNIIIIVEASKDEGCLSCIPEKRRYFSNPLSISDDRTYTCVK